MRKRITETVRRPRLAYITTHAVSADKLMSGQLAYLRQKGFDIVVIAAPSDSLTIVAEREGVDTIAVPMEREMQPWHDFIALLRVYQILRRSKPDIAVAGTPKAGFVGTLAAFLARVPVRFYMLRGLRLESMTGIKRSILTLTERIASCCAHRVICVSYSLRKAYLDRRLTSEAKTLVLHAGSSNGIDAERFRLSDDRRAQVDELRAELTIPREAPVIGYIGRLTRDKGIEELFTVFNCLSLDFPSLRLLLVGEFEQGDPLSENCIKQLNRHPRIILTGEVPDAAMYYGLLDVFVFPSYREGFPNVLLEAAAAGLPVVGFQATGTVDAIMDGVTGALVPKKDVARLASAIKTYLQDAGLRQRHGEAGRARVVSQFCREKIWEALYETYVSSLPDNHRLVLSAISDNEVMEPLSARAA